MTDEWGPWIEHDGGPRLVCFLAGDVAEIEAIIDGIKKSTVKVITKEMVEADASDSARGQIIRYRIRKARGMAILEKILTDLPAPTKRVDA